MHFFTAAIFIAAIVSGCGARSTDKEFLTVEETIGAVFTRPHHGTNWNFYARAHPKAKDCLYKILATADLAEYHQNALLAIGYLGDATDARRLKEALHRDYKGVLSSHQSDAVKATFDALAVMSRRGIPEASKALDQMLTRSYWKDIGFRWRPESSTYALNTVDELVSWVLWAHARTGQTDMLQEKVVALLDEVDEEERRTILRDRHSMKVLLAIEKKMRASEKEPIPQQLRQQLPTIFNGDLDNPVPRGSDTPPPPGPKPPTMSENRGRAIDPKEFATAVTPTFDAWIELYKQEQELRRKLGYGIRESQEYKALAAKKGDARQTFARDVAIHWPYETGGETAQMLVDAAKTLDDARRYAQEYREGKGDRDVALNKFLKLADQFPGTLEHDESLFYGAMLYLQHLRPEMNMDIPAARRLFELLAKRSGPPSQWTVMAEGNLVSFPDDPSMRVKVRSDFVKDMTRRLDPQWLRSHLLVPTKQSSPDRLVRQIGEFLDQLAATHQTTAYNMLSDAKGTPDRLATLKWLREEHADDPFVQIAFAREDKAPRAAGQ
jgi:hypothetical protein